MPRYYFHIVSNTEAFPDTEGIEHPNDAAAHEYAINLIYKTMLYDPEDRDWRGWRINVIDERQALIVTVLFPYRDLRPRRTFGRRMPGPIHLLSVLCVAGWVTCFGDAAKQAVAGTRACTHKIAFVRQATRCPLSVRLLPHWRTATDDS